MSSFEFIINGPPVSQQSRQRQGLHEWKDLVRDEAERLWNPGFGSSKASLRFAVTYYYEDIAVDTEDIVKPIMDALIGLVYNDNSQITGVTQSRQDLYSSFRIPDLSPTLAAGFGRGREFLHVQIDGLESYEELLRQKIDQDVVPEVAPEAAAEIAPDGAEGQETITSTLVSPEGEQLTPQAVPGIEPDNLQHLEGIPPGLDGMQEPETHLGEAAASDEDGYAAAGDQEGPSK